MRATQRKQPPKISAREGKRRRQQISINHVKTSSHQALAAPAAEDGVCLVVGEPAALTSQALEPRPPGATGAAGVGAAAVPGGEAQQVLLLQQRFRDGRQLKVMVVEEELEEVMMEEEVEEVMVEEEVEEEVAHLERDDGDGGDLLECDHQPSSVSRRDNVP